MVTYAEALGAPNILTGPALVQGAPDELLPPVPPAAGAGAQPEEIAAELRFVLARLVRLLRRHASADGLAHPLQSALAVLDHEGPLSPTELAEHEGVAKPSVTPVLAALEAEALVSRRPHAHDGRQCVIIITEKGRAALAQERDKKHAWLAVRLAELDPDDRSTLALALPALRRLVGH
ncbi:MAG: MarR family transcriptional regulator [Acidimicrobiales bacterium]